MSEFVTWKAQSISAGAVTFTARTGFISSTAVTINAFDRKLLAFDAGADVTVVRLFALFHDSRRENECRDPGHGERGARYAALLRGSAYDLSDDLFEKLQYACTWHTDQEHHDDPTIGTCWDADRLDLGRVGIIPEPSFMSTGFAREIADAGSIWSFLPEDQR